MSRIELLQKESSEIMLQDGERKQLRDSLLSYMEKTPVHEPTHDTEDPEQSTRSPYLKSTWLGFVIVAGCVVVVVLELIINHV